DSSSDVCSSDLFSFTTPPPPPPPPPPLPPLCLSLAVSHSLFLPPPSTSSSSPPFFLFHSLLLFIFNPLHPSFWYPSSPLPPTLTVGVARSVDFSVTQCAIEVRILLGGTLLTACR